MISYQRYTGQTGDVTLLYLVFSLDPLQHLAAVSQAIPELEDLLLHCFFFIFPFALCLSAVFFLILHLLFRYVQRSLQICLFFKALLQPPLVMKQEEMTKHS